MANNKQELFKKYFYEEGNPSTLQYEFILRKLPFPLERRLAYEFLDLAEADFYKQKLISLSSLAKENLLSPIKESENFRIIKRNNKSYFISGGYRIAEVSPNLTMSLRSYEEIDILSSINKSFQRLIEKVQGDLAISDKKLILDIARKNFLLSLENALQPGSNVDYPSCLNPIYSGYTLDELKRLGFELSEVDTNMKFLNLKK